jgi:hypothetical protein
MQNPVEERARTTSVRPPAAAGAAGWLVGPLLLAAAVAATRLFLRGADALFLWAVAALVLTAIAWMLVSVFFPASADRTCPRCGRPALERLDARTTRGVVCASCGFRDASASSFLLAEEEGTLEDVVLAERGRRLAPSGGPPAPPPPSSPSTPSTPSSIGGRPQPEPAQRGAHAR